MPDRCQGLIGMIENRPVVTADEVFAVNEKIRWLGLVSDRGDVLLNQMRPGVESYSPSQFDTEFITLGPLTILGVCERYSEYLEGVNCIVVWFGLAAFALGRLANQVLAVCIMKDRQAVINFQEWLEKKQKETRVN